MTESFVLADEDGYAYGVFESELGALLAARRYIEEELREDDDPFVWVLTKNEAIPEITFVHVGRPPDPPGSPGVVNFVVTRLEDGLRG